MNETPFDRALTFLRTLEEESLDLICCSSPPFDLPGLQVDGSTGQSGNLIALFTPLVRACARALRPSGSLILELEGGWISGSPLRRLFPYELIIHLVRPVEAGGEGWHLAQELYLFDAAHCTTPDVWLAREGCRVADPMRTAWWLSRTPFPKADNRRVLKPYSRAQRALMQRGDAPCRRPSAHRLSGKFGRDNGGAIPPNLIAAPNLWIDGPVLLPAGKNRTGEEEVEAGILLLEFAIRLCTEVGDRICDPFDRSGGKRQQVAAALERHWISPSDFLSDTSQEIICY